MLGLLALAVSLVGGSSEGTGGTTVEILLWLGATAAAAVVALALGRPFGGRRRLRRRRRPVLLDRRHLGQDRHPGRRPAAFAAGVIVGYSLGTFFLQLGYQKSRALTVAGIATLLTNALPIAAGSVVLGEPVPSGVYGALRILAFAAVTAGAILLARPGRGS